MILLLKGTLSQAGQWDGGCGGLLRWLHTSDMVSIMAVIINIIKLTMAVMPMMNTWAGGLEFYWLGWQGGRPSHWSDLQGHSFS